LKSFFFLDSVLSTKIITLVYWLLLLGVWISGIGLIGIGSQPDDGSKFSGGFGVVAGIALIIVGTLISRLWAEFMVVMFKIQQNTRRTAELLDKLGKNNSPL